MDQKKIKVLEICYSLKAAGIETFVTNVQKHLDHSLIEAHYMLINGAKEDYFYKDDVVSNEGIIEDATSSSHNFFIRRIQQRLKYIRILKKGKYDIVHVHASSGLQGVDVLIAHLMGVKNIIVHSHCHAESAELYFSGKDHVDLKIKSHYKGLKEYQKYATSTMACSTEAARWLFGDMASETCIVKNGILTENYKFDEAIRDETREKLNIHNSFVMGTIGRFSPPKNQLFSIRLTTLLKERGYDIKLILIGQGPMEEELKAETKRLGVEDSVIFTGVTNKVNEYLFAMDLYLFPSIFEGLGIVGIEAQASGLSCIISDKIPKEVKVLDDAVMLPLDEDAWVQEIIKHIDSNRGTKNRLSAYKQVADAGWDMKESAKLIERKYVELIEKQSE